MRRRRRQQSSTDVGDIVQSQRFCDDQAAAIAACAAALIEGGLVDRRAAKLKALHQLGLPARSRLPDDHQIELALQTHQALYAQGTHARELAGMRNVALAAMRLLHDFSPWLVGSVLSGTANRHAEIDLELVGVEPKGLEHFLLNQGIGFETLSDQTGGDSTKLVVARYRLEMDGVPIRLTLFDSQALRARARPRTHSAHSRVQIERLKELVSLEADTNT